MIHCAESGCFTSDDPQSRALHHDGGGSDGMTVEDCVSVCQAGGYALAAVEFGLQCCASYSRPEFNVRALSESSLRQRGLV